MQFRSIVSLACAVSLFTGSALASAAYARRVDELTMERDIYASREENWMNKAVERKETIEQLQTEVEQLTDTIAADQSIALTYAGEFQCTAYCSEEYPHICGEGQGITSSGAKVQPGVTVAAEDAEKAKRDAAREEDRMIGESFHNITELMFNLRREFVVELAPADCKKGFPVIARYMACAADDNFDLDLNLIGSILGVELSPKFVDSSGKDWYKILDEDGVYGTMPEKVLLAIAYSTMDSSYCGYWDKNWNVESQKYVYAYRENPTLDATYEMLMALGYEISDDEQALRDGTHKIFREYGSDEKKWSDCDYCKAAHPNCDKCCKACDEPCNAVQDCKKNEERTENDE